MSKTATAVGPVTNGAKDIIALSHPYQLSVTVEGIAAFLYHRWDPESVDAKAAAAKGSKAKKEDDVNSYVARDDRGMLSIPGEYFRQSIIHAAKFVQDPRSPRKSAMDLYKAGVIVTTEFCSVGKKDWDYLDKRRAVIQRNAINRVRPALLKGWRCTFALEVILPEYINRDTMLSVIGNAGRLIGVGDFRPTFGRFATVDVAD